MEPSKENLFKKGFYFGVSTSLEYVVSLEDCEIKDSDIFITTYPKSGTLWIEHFELIIHEGHHNGTENVETMDRIPWLEHKIKKKDYADPPLPRVFATQLPYYLVPRDLRNKRGCIVYVTRNPKDVMVSYYHFSKFMSTLEEVPDFNLFMERFLAGEVLASLWLDHVAGWYSHAEGFNILFLTVFFASSRLFKVTLLQDLRSAVLEICNVLGKKLSEEEVDSVVRQATSENMRKDPRANYENLPDDIVVKDKRSFLRKGKVEAVRCNNYLIPHFLVTVGDWKTIMTVAQSERFDKVPKEKMKTLPITFIWDINDEM
ncbi:LOW QUALITY PROTEIN: amine sulfotransferase-like [Sarcoramphus papa]